MNGYQKNIRFKSDVSFANAQKSFLERFFTNKIQQRSVMLGNHIIWGMLVCSMITTVDILVLYFQNDPNFKFFLIIRAVGYQSVIIFGTVLFMVWQRQDVFRIALALIAGSNILSMLLYIICLTPSSVPPYFLVMHEFMFFLGGSLIAVDRRWASVSVLLMYIVSILGAIMLSHPAQMWQAIWIMTCMTAIAFAIGISLDDFADKAENLLVEQRLHIERLRNAELVNFDIMKTARISLHAEAQNKSLIAHSVRQNLSMFSNHELSRLLNFEGDVAVIEGILRNHGFSILDDEVFDHDGDLFRSNIESESGEKLILSIREILNGSRILLVFSNQDRPETEADKCMDEFGASFKTFSNSDDKLKNGMDKDSEMVKFLSRFDTNLAMKIGKSDETFTLISNANYTLLILKNLESLSQCVFVMKQDTWTQLVNVFPKERLVPDNEYSRRTQEILQEHPEVPIASSLEAINSPIKPLNILLVDDNKVLLKSLTKLIESAGYNVEGFISFESVLNQASSKFNFDVAFIDFRIAEKSGIELGRRLKENFPQLRCILLTGELSQIDDNLAIQGGFNQVLIKPASLNQIIEAIEKR